MGVDSYASITHFENNTLIDGRLELQWIRPHIIKNNVFENNGRIYINGDQAGIVVHNNTFYNRAIEYQSNYRFENSTFTNNVFNNHTQSNLFDLNTLKSSNNLIINNTFIDVGAFFEWLPAYWSSLSPLEFNNTNYNSVYLYINPSLQFTLVSQDDHEVTDFANGTTNFDLWLCKNLSTGLKFTIYMDSTYPGTCTALCNANSLTCDYEQNNTFMSNGVGNNYTWYGNTSFVNVITNYTTPPYIRYEEKANFTYAPIYVENAVNTQIMSNLFISNKNYSPIITNSSNQVYVWRNFFEDQFPLEILPAYFCVLSQGNFYTESMGNKYFPSTECGPIIFAELDDEVLTWDAQSPYAFETVYYDAFFDGVYLGNTSKAYWNVPGYEEGTFELKIVPFLIDDPSTITLNDRVNGTVYSTNVSTINQCNEIVRGFNSLPGMIIIVIVSFFGGLAITILSGSKEYGVVGVASIIIGLLIWGVGIALIGGFC